MSRTQRQKKDFGRLEKQSFLILMFRVSKSAFDFHFPKWLPVEGWDKVQQEGINWRFAPELLKKETISCSH